LVPNTDTWRFGHTRVETADATRKWFEGTAARSLVLSAIACMIASMFLADRAYGSSTYWFVVSIMTGIIAAKTGYWAFLRKATDPVTPRLNPLAARSATVGAVLSIGAFAVATVLFFVELAA